MSGFTAFVDADFWDTGYFAPFGTPPNNAVTHDAYARTVLTTSDTSLTVEAVWGATAPFNTVAVYVNGVYNQTITDTQSVATKIQHTITLPAGLKTVELVEGAFLTGVSSTAYSIQRPPASVTNYLSGFGDSIMAGYYASPLMLGFLPGLFRHDIAPRFDGVACYGIPSDSLWHEGNNGANDFTNFLATWRLRTYATGERAFLLQYGTNDYGRVGPGLWSAADFLVGANAVLDQIHALDPTAKVYWILPFHRQTETANLYGNTLDDYRNSIISAVNAHSSFAQYFDGRDAFSVAEIIAGSPDGLHPGPALHDKAAGWLLGQFGIVRPVGVVSAAAVGTPSVVLGVTPGTASSPDAIGALPIGF